MNELVFTRNDQVVTSSRNVARDFGKRHDNVLREIRRFIQRGFLTEDDIQESNYTHPQNKQEYRQFLLTEKGKKKIYNYYYAQTKRRKPNILYILKHMGFNGFYKIGITHDLKSRISSHGTSSPLGIKVVYRVKADNANELEQYIHESLSNRRRNGEWFQLTKKELITVINDIKERIEFNESISI